MPWTTVTLYSGAQVDLYMQQFRQECGPSCVATIGRILGKGMDIGPARRKVGKIDPSYFYGPHAWDAEGAYIESLTAALAEYGVRMAHTRSFSPANYKTFCEGRTLRNPAILQIRWRSGGMHFVVTVGKNGADQQSFIEILDPGYGYQRASLHDFPEYGPRDPDTRVVVGRGTLRPVSVAVTER